MLWKALSGWKTCTNDLRTASGFSSKLRIDSSFSNQLKIVQTISKHRNLNLNHLHFNTLLKSPQTKIISNCTPFMLLQTITITRYDKQQ
jgi:hypothetical protein